MIGNSAKREEVPESLFTLDDDVEEPTTSVKPKKVPPAPESDASPEFKQLISQVDQRVQRRNERKQKTKTIAASSFERTVSETQDMIESGDWAKCGARHLVALYALMHKKCYGVEALELGPTERYNAMMMAANLVKNSFAGDYVASVEYMRWAWTREIAAERKRQERGQETRRMGTRLIFGKYLLADYALAQKRSRT